MWINNRTLINIKWVNKRIKDAAKNLKKAAQRLGITPDKVTTTKSGVRKTTYKGKIDMGSVKKEETLVKRPSKTK